MSGRLVDVGGVSPEGVLFSAATNPAYGDAPRDRVALIAGWVATANATVHEVELALDTARLYMIEDPDDAEAAQALVVLARVLRVVGQDGGR